MTELPTTDRYGRETGHEVYPAFMPGAEDDDTLGPARGPRAEAAKLLDAASHELGSLSGVLGDRALPDGVRRLSSEATSAISDVRKQVHHAAGNLDALAANDLLPQRGKERLINKAKATTAAALRELDARSESAIMALEAGLTATAQPSWPAGADRAEARESFRLLVDAEADDPAAIVRELVTDPDPALAAVAASSYAQTYLRSRGVPQGVITATATFAAQHALTSTDPTRRAAALALTKLDDLRKAKQKSFVAANFAIGWE
jgi:hypothetical protein